MKVISKILVVVLILAFAGCANMSKKEECIMKSTIAGAVFGGGAGAAAGKPALIVGAVRPDGTAMAGRLPGSDGHGGLRAIPAANPGSPTSVRGRLPGGIQVPELARGPGANRGRGPARTVA